MTDKETKELEKFFETQPLKVRRLIYKWLKQQKELAVAEYRLKKEMETKFYGSGSDPN
jgi:hypothetical protein